jgi:hypothetical protein
MLQWRRLLPWSRVVEKLGLAAAETLTKPSLCRLVQQGQTVEKGDPVFGKCVWVV